MAKYKQISMTWKAISAFLGGGGQEADPFSFYEGQYRICDIEYMINAIYFYVASASISDFNQYNIKGFHM